MTATVQYQVVRLILLMLSVLGWVIFLVGFAKQEKVYCVLEFLVTGSDIFKGVLAVAYKFKETLENLFNTIAAPIWLFVVPPPVLFTFMILHIFKRGENSGHIFHAIIMFLDLFYKLGASIVIVISLLAVKSTGIGEELSIRKTNALLMLSGCVTSVFFYWISSMVWPLFLLRRPYRQYYEELLEN